MPNWGLCWPLKKRARVDEEPEVVVEFFGRKSGGVVATAEGDAPVTFDLVDLSGDVGGGGESEVNASALRGEDMQIEAILIDFDEVKEEVPVPELKADGEGAEVRVEMVEGASNGERMDEETEANVEEKKEEVDLMTLDFIPDTFPEDKKEVPEPEKTADVMEEGGEDAEAKENKSDEKVLEKEEDTNTNMGDASSAEVNVVENGERMEVETEDDVEEKKEEEAVDLKTLDFADSFPEDKNEVPEPEKTADVVEDAGDASSAEANVAENEELMEEGTEADVEEKKEEEEVDLKTLDLIADSIREDKNEPEPEKTADVMEEGVDASGAHVKVENGEAMETEASLEKKAEDEEVELKAIDLIADSIREDKNEVPEPEKTADVMEDGGDASGPEVNAKNGERMETEASVEQRKEEEEVDLKTINFIADSLQEDKNEVPESDSDKTADAMDGGGDASGGAHVKVENGEGMETEANVEKKAEDEEVDLTALDLVADSFPEDKDVIWEVTCVSCWEPCPPQAGVACHFGHSLCSECRLDLDLDPELPRGCPAQFVLEQEEGEQEEPQEQDEPDWDEEREPDHSAKDMCAAEFHKIDLEVQAAPYFKYFMENSKYSCGAKVFGCDVELPGHLIGHHEKTDCPYRFYRYCGFQKDGCKTLFKSLKHQIHHLITEHNVPMGFRNEGHFLVRYDREEYFDEDPLAIKPLIRAIIESRNQHSLYFLMVDDLQTEDGKVARIWVANAFVEQNKKRDRDIVAKIAISSQIQFDGMEKCVYNLIDGEISIAAVPSLQTLGENLSREPKKKKDDNRIYYVDVPHEDLDLIAVMEDNKKYFDLMIMICVDTDLPLTVDDFVDQEEARDLMLAEDMTDDEDDTYSDDLAEFV